MKKIIVIFLIFFGCGQSESKSSVDLSNTTIVWQGHPYEHVELLERFDATMTCLSTFNIYRIGYPSVVLTKGPFYCKGSLTLGCYSLNTVYLVDSNYIGTIDVFKHEVIHWATKTGDADHGKMFFSVCEAP